MPRHKGSAAVPSTPRSADELPNLERVARCPTLTPRDRERVRQLLAGPLAELRIDVVLTEAALAGPDPEFAAYRLTGAIKALRRSLAGVERGLAKVGRPQR